MNGAVVIGIAGALVGVLQASFSLGLSRSPSWPESRPFAAVALTAAGYCLFDLVPQLDVTPATAAWGVQIALVFGVLHGIAWVEYLAVADRRALQRPEQLLVWSGALVALGGLVPGVFVTHEIVRIHIDWLGVTYPTPQPTTLGVLAYAYFCIAMLAVVVRAWARWHQGWHARLPAVGVMVITLLALNDTLVSAQILPMPLLFDAGSIVIVVTVGQLHHRRFAADAERLEAFSARLEREVESRTSELLQTQATLLKAEKMASLGRIAAGVAHEINNPIAVVQHSLERLQREAITQDERGARNGEHIVRGLVATHRVVQVVRHLQDAGRASGFEPTRVTAFALAPAIKRALAAVQAGLGRARVTTHVDDQLSAYGDPAMFEQAVVNVLVNAVEALAGRDAGGTEAHIDVRASVVGARVCVAIADNGPGIPPDVQSRLFEPFTTTKPVGRNSGLGLSVSHGLMRAQQGDLVVLRTSSAGTEIGLDLEWSPAHAAEEPVSAPVGRAAEAALRVLIIDDEKDVREILRDSAAEFFDVEMAASVDQGFERLASGAPIDVVLCDLMMPDGGADEWITGCRKRRSPLADRTIVITGGPTTADAMELLDTYHDRVLYKPFSATAMREMILRMAAPVR